MNMEILIEKEEPNLWIKRTLSVLAITGYAASVLAFNPGVSFEPDPILEIASIQGNSVLAVSSPEDPVRIKKVKVVITAYSSTSWQTDDTPFTTASGKTVEQGIVANNMLAFGTEIKIPELYGDEIFVVEDRMNKKKGNYHVDIWFSEYQQAKDFGSKTTYIEILES